MRGIAGTGPRPGLRRFLHAMLIIRPSDCAASSKTGSLSSVSAWSGVLETSRRATQTSPLGASKVVEHRERSGAFGEGVKAAAIGVAAVAGLPLQAAVRSVGRDAGGLRREDARPADLLREQVADPQRGIADHLRLQPDARAARQQAVLRVLRQQFRRDPRRLPVCCTRDDPAVHRLHRPAILDQLGSPASRVARGGWEARPGSRNPPGSAPIPCRRTRPTAGSRSRGRSADSRTTPAIGPAPAGSPVSPWARAARTRARPARPARLAWRNSPRLWMKVGRGLAGSRSVITSVVRYGGSSFRSCSISARSLASSGATLR